MLVAALALVFAGAGMHAAWNILLKGSPDPLRMSQRALLAGTAIFAAPVAAAWWLTGHPVPGGRALLLAVASSIVEAAYFAFLSHAYRNGELTFVYPVARGTGPVVAVLGGVLVLGERFGPVQAAGIAALVVGTWMLRRPAGAAAPLAAALATGLCIGTYTTIDRAGAQAAQPWVYGWIVFALTATLLTAVLAFRARGGRPAPGGDPPGAGRSAVVGFLMTATFFLLLFALALAPVSLVAPARESAIVLVGAWGVLRLRERAGLRLKLAGAGLILAGVVLEVL